MVNIKPIDYSEELVANQGESITRTKSISKKKALDKLFKILQETDTDVETRELLD